MHQYHQEPGLKVTSCPDAIARVIQKVAKLSNGNGNGLNNNLDDISDIEYEKIPRTASCPECGSPIEHESGCVVCRNCGFSKCG